MSRPSLVTRTVSAFRAFGRAFRGAVSRSYYAGAAVNRLVYDWITSSVSADREIRSDLTLLRARARELVRNNGYARRYVALVANNVAGPHGIRLYPRIAFGDGKLKATYNAEIAAKFADWSRAANASADGRHSWPALQRVICSALPQDGEVLVQIVDRWDESPYGFSLHLIDPDQLDHTFNRAGQSGVNEIRMGVEVDRFQRPVAYHLFTAHPCDLNPSGRERIRIPADQIVHLYRADRPGQTRGVPWFAPVMSALKMLQGYEEAEVVAARTAAAKMAFIHDQPGSDVAPADPNAQNASQVWEGQPGVIEELPTGKGITFWDPTHPSGNYGPFIKTNLRHVASGLPGASYHALTNDYSESNYSSSRMAEMENRDEWRGLQRLLIDQLHERVYLEFMRRGLLLGSIALPTRDYTRWMAHTFVPRGFGYINPAEEIEALHSEIQLGVNSRTRIVAGMGEDIETIFAELSMENELAEKYDLTLGADTHIESFGDVGDDAEQGPPKQESEPVRSAPLRIARSQEVA